MERKDYYSTKVYKFVELKLFHSRTAKVQLNNSGQQGHPGGYYQQGQSGPMGYQQVQNSAMGYQTVQNGGMGYQTGPNGGMGFQTGPNGVGMGHQTQTHPPFGHQSTQLSSHHMQNVPPSSAPPYAPNGYQPQPLIGSYQGHHDSRSMQEKSPQEYRDDAYGASSFTPQSDYNASPFSPIQPQMTGGHGGGGMGMGGYSAPPPPAGFGFPAPPPSASPFHSTFPPLQNGPNGYGPAPGMPDMWS